MALSLKNQINLPLAMKQVIFLIITVFSFFSSFAQTTNGLVVYYPFNGNANDESGNGINGTVLGATLTDDKDGNPNSAYSFDGNDYISFNSSNLLSSNYTYSAWVKLGSGLTEPFHCVIALGGPGADQHLGITDVGSNEIRWALGAYNSPSNPTSQFTAKTSQTPEIDQWSHLVGVRNNDSIMIYLNGEFFTSASTNGTLPRYNSPYYAHIGVRAGAFVQYFKGAIDEVRIYNRALDAGEIEELFDPQGIPDPNISYWEQGNSGLYYNGGNVSINTTEAPAGYHLAVDGKGVFNEIQILLPQNWNWPDYVFEEGYDLENLVELEKYVLTEKHLPGIPSKSEIEEHGFAVGEMNTLLLKKIEELFLHQIELSKKLEEQKRLVEALQNQVKAANLDSKN